MDYKSCQVSDATLKVTGDTTLEYWGTVSSGFLGKGVLILEAIQRQFSRSILTIKDEERLSKLGLR